MQRHLASLLLLLLPLAAYSQKNVDWCLYFRILKTDHLRPECNGIYRTRMLRQKDHIPLNVAPLPREFLPSFRRFKQHRMSMSNLTRKTLGLHDCSDVVTECRDSRLCQNGLMCLSNTGYCCLNFERITMANRCSATELSGIQCHAVHPSAVCRQDFQCRFTPKRRCCPTSCGYNICI